MAMVIEIKGYQDLPKEIERDEFDGLVEVLGNEPYQNERELFILYQELDQRIRILTIGDLDASAEDISRILQQKPEFGKNRIRKYLVHIAQDSPRFLTV